MVKPTKTAETLPVLNDAICVSPPEIKLLYFHHLARLVPCKERDYNPMID